MKEAHRVRYAMTAVAYLAMAIIVGMINAPLTEAASIELIGAFTGPGYPDAGLIQGADGSLYGTTAGGGNDTVFRVLSDGTFETIATLQCATEGCDGGNLFGGASLIQIGDFLYGTRSIGGSPNNGGTIFEVNLQTGASRAIHVFQLNAVDAFTYDGLDGRQPNSGLILSNGFLYGTTPFGGEFNQGAAYRIRPDGSAFAIIHSFRCISEADCAYLSGRA